METGADRSDNGNRVSVGADIAKEKGHMGGRPGARRHVVDGEPALRRLGRLRDMADNLGGVAHEHFGLAGHVMGDGLEVIGGHQVGLAGWSRKVTYELSRTHWRTVGTSSAKARSNVASQVSLCTTVAVSPPCFTVWPWASSRGAMVAFRVSIWKVRAAVASALAISREVIWAS